MTAMGVNETFTKVRQGRDCGESVWGCGESGMGQRVRADPRTISGLMLGKGLESGVDFVFRQVGGVVLDEVEAVLGVFAHQPLDQVLDRLAVLIFGR